MKRRVAVRAVLVLIVAVNTLVVVVALSRSDDSAEAVEPVRVSVTMLDPGAEPHEVLRFTPQVGSTLYTTLQTQGQSTVRAPGESPAMFDLPKLEIDLTSTVTDVEADQITVEMAATDYRLGDRDSIEASVLTDVDRELQAVIDAASETQVVDSRGVVTRGSIESVRERRSMLGVMPATYAPGELYPLPVEPIGVGARWQTHSQFSGGELGGRDLIWDVTIHIELVELDGDHALADIRYDATLLLDSDRPLIDGSRIVSMDQSFTGSVTWYFDHPGALISGEGTTTARMLTDLRGRQVTVEVEQRTELSETRTG